MTLQDIQRQLGSFFGGGQAGDWGGGSVSQTGMTYPTQENTNMNWSPVAGAGAVSGAAGLGFNMPTAGLAIGGLQALGSFLQGNKALSLAQDQFKFQKNLANANLNNSIKSYNNTLEDRLNARGVMEGRDAASVADEINRKRLSR